MEPQAWITLGGFLLLWLLGYLLIRKDKNEDGTVSRKGFAKMGIFIIIVFIIIVFVVSLSEN